MLLISALIIAALQAFLVVIHLSVAATLATAFGISGSWLPAAFTILALTFISSVIIARWSGGGLFGWYYAAASYWFGLVHYLFVASVGFFIIATTIYFTNHFIPPVVIGSLCFGGIFLLHIHGTCKSLNVVITKITVELPGIPDHWRGKKIVFLSDVHLGAILMGGFAAQVVKKVQALAPEAVFIGGDLYDGPACDFKKVSEPLRALKASLGVYFVTGNHEYFLREPDKAMDVVRDLGIKILKDEIIELNGISVFGVDYKTTHEREDFRKVMASVSIPRDKPTIIIKHEPKDLDLARDAGFALGFFGHTHAGQIFPMSYLTRLIYKGFDYGLKKLGEMRIYTSSGAGTWGPPLRLGTKSEIVCVTFK